MSRWTDVCASTLDYVILKKTSENNEGKFKNEILNLIALEKLKTLILEMCMLYHNAKLLPESS